LSNLQKILILGFLSFVWGTTWIAIKYSLLGFPPFVGAAARFTVAAVVLYLYALYQSVDMRINNRHDFYFILISSVLLYLLDYGLIYWGEQYINAGATAVLFATFPLFTGVVANFVFHSEPFQLQKYLGLVIGFLGIAIVFYDQLVQTDFNGLVFFAALAIVLSALSAAISLVMVKKYLGHLPTVSLTLHQMIWGVLMLGIVGILLGESHSIQWVTESVLAIVYMGVVASALAFVLYYRILKEMSAITVSSIIYITPIVAIIIGWLLLDEAITKTIIIGMMITFTGIFIAQLNDYRIYLNKSREAAVKAGSEINESML
jgi:drug/metabolite transporter (DMT)-like permease